MMSARVTRPCVSLASRNPEYRSSSNRPIRVADAVPLGVGPTNVVPSSSRILVECYRIVLNESRHGFGHRPILGLPPKPAAYAYLTTSHVQVHSARPRRASPPARGRLESEHHNMRSEGRIEGKVITHRTKQMGGAGVTSGEEGNNSRQVNER